MLETLNKLVNSQWLKKTIGVDYSSKKKNNWRRLSIFIFDYKFPHCSTSAMQNSCKYYLLRPWSRVWNSEHHMYGFPRRSVFLMNNMVLVNLTKQTAFAAFWNGPLISVLIQWFLAFVYKLVCDGSFGFNISKSSVCCWHGKTFLTL